MTDSKKALVAFHDRMDLEVYCDILSEKGLEVTAVASLDGMLSQMGLSLASMPHLEPSADFGLYLMDANLGEPGSPNINPAIKIYSHIFDLYRHGTVKFLVMAGLQDTLDRARDFGLPFLKKGAHITEIYNALKIE